MELLVVLGVSACLAAALFVIYRRLAGAGASLPVTAEWINELSVDRYQPMRHLLDNEDLGFPGSRPGFRPHMAAGLRRERCRLFRTYLRCLHSDFQRISMALKIVMVQSRYDRPDLAAVLVRTQRAFIFGMILVHCRLAFYRFGLASVDVADLLKVFDNARLELRSLIPAQVGIAA